MICFVVGSCDKVESDSASVVVAVAFYDTCVEDTAEILIFFVEQKSSVLSIVLLSLYMEQAYLS